MNKVDLQVAINAIPHNDIFSKTIKGGRGYSRENEITELIKNGLGVGYSTQVGIGGKVIDLVENPNGQIINVLEAKHYGPHQDDGVYRFVFNSASGPASDSLKLRSLGYTNHFLIQYTSQIIGITGTNNEISNLINGANRDYDYLNYLLDRKGNIIQQKIIQANNENWKTCLLNFFVTNFDPNLIHGTINIVTPCTPTITIELDFHYFIMEIQPNPNILVNMYP